MVALININLASRDELSTLPGIGLVLADRIIDYREEAGSFDQITDLLAVPGITGSVLDGIRNCVDVGDQVENKGPDPAEIHRQYVAHRLEGGDPPTPEVHRRVRRQFDRLPGAIQRPSSDVALAEPPDPAPKPPDQLGDYSTGGRS